MGSLKGRGRSPCPLLSSKVPVADRAVTGDEPGGAKLILPRLPAANHRLLARSALADLKARNRGKLSDSIFLGKDISDLARCQFDVSGDSCQDRSFQLLGAPELVEGDPILRGQVDQVLSVHCVSPFGGWLFSFLVLLTTFFPDSQLSVPSLAPI